MTEQTAMMQTTPRPFYAEAREYCEQHGIDSPEDMERTRLSMCCMEFRRRMEPWQDMLAKVHPSRYSTNPNEPPPESFVKLQEQVQEIASREAASLGLEWPTTC